MIASRTSIYDNDFYLATTNPATIPKEAPLHTRASIIMMHVYIQLPRLVCLVRHATNYPDDSRTLASAVALAESLWSHIPSALFSSIIRSSTALVDPPPCPSIADIVPHSYRFTSVQDCMLICRFWRLQISLSGPIQTLYQNFPAECALSLLPSLPDVRQTDYDAAIDLARAIRYALTVCPSLPLIPLRVYTCFQVSIGTWGRQMRADADAVPPPSASASAPAARMEAFVARTSNAVHDMWAIHHVDTRFLRAAAVDMAGGPIPDWMPVHVKFESEDGDMVMQMEYRVTNLFDDGTGEKGGEGGDGDGGGRAGWVRKTRTVSPFGPGTTGRQPGKGFPNG